MKQEEPLFYNDYKRKSTWILKKKKNIRRTNEINRLFEKEKIIESNLIDIGRPRKDIVGFSLKD